ncbi:methyl-accepting chemotaxis protein [Rariglobus hedericola]|uniref:Methyl-accepting chemotaxis protein n=1 Tax=Rariglobus hedericola TaxID=2597822 RepID=A0A556QJL7_9BACT|nr:CHASE3 domain-containing protein [Rariglobus hedericola]TSJ76840.1 methyl-accepting chemotaxis protein [Rariglobus hedericola]
MIWSIGKKILLGYLLALLLLALIGVGAFLGVRELLSAAAIRTHTYQVIGQIEQIELEIVNAETSQRGYVLSGQETYLEPYKVAVGQVSASIAKLAELTKDNPEQQARIARLEVLADDKMKVLAESISLRRNDGMDAAMALFLKGTGKQIMDKVRALSAELRNTELELLAVRSLRAEADARRVNLIILAGTPIAGVILLIVGLLVARGIARPLARITHAAEQIASGDPTVELSSAAGRSDEVGQLSRSFTRMGKVLAEVAAVNTRIAQGDLSVTVTPQSASDKFGNAHHQMIDKLSQLVGAVQRAGLQVNTSATEIAATSKQQQATATEIAATTTEIGATSREISATSKELVRTVSEVNRVAEETAQLAGNGQSGLGRMEGTMRNIMDASGTISGKLAVLNEKATNINAVVTTITKVADQTNLLSLNAAIEAEKAGEYGLGFAVVATEIRRLADQTAVATYDIEQMVKEMQSAVSAGVMGMDKFSEEVRRGVDEVRQVGAQLTQIIQQVQALTPRFEAVNEGMQSQSTGAQQITEALLQLSESAQQTAESLRSSSIAIGHLNEAARDLQNGVARFKLRG